MKDLINFLFEVGYLDKVHRSPRKNNSKSISEHSFRVAIIGYVLGLIEKVDPERLASMCLFHDLTEARVGDMDLLNKKYVSLNETQAADDAFKAFGGAKLGIGLMVQEFHDAKTKVAQLATDADILEELLTEKEQFDHGDKRAQKWMKHTLARLQTRTAKKLGSKIIKSDSDNWWKSFI